MQSCEVSKHIWGHHMRSQPRKSAFFGGDEITAPKTITEILHKKGLPLFSMNLEDRHMAAWVFHGFCSDSTVKRRFLWGKQKGKNKNQSDTNWESTDLCPEMWSNGKCG